MSDTFNDKAKTWDDSPNRLELVKAFLDELNMHAYVNKDMKVLDFGCGTGLVGLTFCDTAKEVLFIDTSHGMLEVLAQKVKIANTKNAKIIKGDISEAGIEENSIDLIFSLMAFHHVKNIPSVLKTFYSIMKTGASVVIADLVTEDGSFHKNEDIAHKGFNIGYIKVMFEQSGFFVDDIYEYNKLKRPDASGNIKEYTQFAAVAIKP